MRGALLCGRSSVIAASPLTDSFAVVTPHVPLVCIVGLPDEDVVDEALESVEDAAEPLPVLAVTEATATHVARVLDGWPCEAVLIHTRPGPVPRVSDGIDVRWLEPSHAVDPDLLTHVPAGLREEILDAAAHTPVACAWFDGRPAAFCHAPWLTEGWFDISIDTLEPYRRRGLGLACAEALIGLHEASGRRPVWGAVESNEASRALAARLGFAPIARLTVFQRPAIFTAGS